MLQAAALRALCTCLAIAFAGTPSQAKSYLSDPSVSFGRDLPSSKDVAFYRAWADPIRGGPQNLGAGRWILETDRNTRLAYPRLVALTDGASITRANYALEAMHGRVLKTAYQAESALSGRRFGELDTRFGDFAVHLSTVKVTYLSSSVLSLVAVGEEALGGNGGSVLVGGAAVDIVHGKIFTIRSCREELSRPFFTFGPLLTVCDDRKLEAFRTLWHEQGQIAGNQVPVGPRQENRPTQKDCRSLAMAYINEMRRFSLYLTEAGLAVHNAFAVGAWENVCVTDPDSPYFPVIIPWRKLAPLMNPGLLRDELLTPN
jgi:hypothetical protein